MNFQLVIQILKSRFFLVAFILILTVATTALITSSLPKKYAASTSIVLTFQNSGPFEQLGMPSQLAGGYIATQVDIIRSHNVALKVVDRLKLADSSKAREDFLTATEGKGTIEDWLADWLLDDLEVQPSRDSLVVTIAFSSTDPVFAAQAADAFAQSYIDATLELSMEPARRNAAWFDSQIKTLRANLEEGQARLTSYQQEKGIIALDERLDTETHRLDELSTNLVEAQQEAYDVKSRQLGWKHPEYRRAVEREESLERLLDEQKLKVLNLKQQRDELNMLAREVETTRNTYDAAMQRYYHSSLESQFNQTNIAVLSQAVPAMTPSSPKVVLNLVLSVFLGIIFGTGFALIFEATDRRIRMENDVSEVLKLPVLTTL